MPTGQRNKTATGPSFLKVAFLLLQFILVKIGSIPLKLLDPLFIASKKIADFEAPHFPKLSIPKLKSPKLPTFQHGRGRPRKSWFIPFYLSKFKYFLRRRVPKKTKVVVALGVFAALTYIYTSFIFVAAYQLPSPTKLVSPDKAQTTEFYDRNGKLLYRMYEGRNRILVNLSDLPPYLITATIATEDKNFYKHFGFDPIAIARAFYHNQTGQPTEGASTITQQLIKNTLLTPEKTITRKLKEVILAFWAERIYTKDEILQMYFNESPYGGPIWGIEAASQTYFDKKAKDLNIAEATFLAGLPASPTNFSPYGANPEASKNRQGYVLDRMVEEKYITENQKGEILATPLNLKQPQNNILAPHFVFYVKDILAQKYGERAVSQGGLRIQTSLDLETQLDVERIVKSEVQSLSNLNVRNGAAMVTDAKTGQILAMVGSKDYYDPKFGNFNVTTSLRQPGSSIKPFTYITGFKNGFTPGNTILDTPVAFRDQWGNSYAPVNYDGRFHGPVSIRTALGSSYNIPAVKMLSIVGVDAMIETSKDFGITTFTDPKRYGLSLTLGGGEVKMTDMMTAYGTLSQMGQKREITPILRVTDSSGNILEEYEDKGTQVVDAELAYLISDILSDNSARTPAFGVNSLLNVGRGIAVKTGTTDLKKDNWTFGYSNSFVVGVWVGNNDNTPMNQSLTSGITGASPIWRKITDNMLIKYPSQAFARPDGVAQITVDRRKDLGLTKGLPKSLTRVTQKDDKLTFSDPFSSYSTPSAQAANPGNTTN